MTEPERTDDPVTENPLPSTVDPRTFKALPPAFDTVIPLENDAADPKVDVPLTESAVVNGETVLLMIKGPLSKEGPARTCKPLPVILT